MVATLRTLARIVGYLVIGTPQAPELRTIKVRANNRRQ